MGCDIHLHQEIGAWHHYRHRSVPRSYQLFAMMAGVRNRDKLTPVAPVRGLPSDASVVTKFDYELWNDDAHNASWLLDRLLQIH